MTTNATLSIDAANVETSTQREMNASSPRGTARAGAMSVADQAVISAASFLTTVIMGRYAAPEQLGIYYIAFQTIVFARQIQSRLVSAPYSVNCFRRPAEERSSYAGSTLIHQLIISLVAAVLLIANWWGHIASAAPQPFIDAVLILIIACPLMMLHDHLRQTMFVHRQMKLTLSLSTGMLLAHALVMGVLATTGQLTASTVIGALAATHGIACAIWYFGSSNAMEFGVKSIKSDWWRNWTFGKWALVSKLIGECSPFVVPLIVTAQLGAKETAVFAACGGLVGTANVFVGGIGRFLNANAPRVYTDRGVWAMCSLLLRTAGMFLLVIGSMNVVLFFFAEAILSVIYDGKYDAAANMVFVMSLMVLIASISVVAGSGLWAVSKPRANVPADVVTTLMIIGSVAALLPVYGVIGAAYGMVIGIAIGTAVRVASFLFILQAMDHPTVEAVNE
jgi:O-antigen/teichoic acid export membrane protein